MYNVKVNGEDEIPSFIEWKYGDIVIVAPTEYNQIGSYNLMLSGTNEFGWSFVRNIDFYVH